MDTQAPGEYRRLSYFVWGAGSNRRKRDLGSRSRFRKLRAGGTFPGVGDSPTLGEVVLPATPGGSPANGKRQVKQCDLTIRQGQANFEAMVRKNMVDKGNTQEEAESSTRILIAVAELIDHVELSVGSEGEFTSATLRVGLDL